MTARLLSNLASPKKRLAVEPSITGIAHRYPVGEDAIHLYNRFNLAVKLSGSVNQLIYLPLLAVLLLFPARSRLLDAWDFPPTYAALLTVTAFLAIHCAMRLRRVARKLRENVLRELNRKVEQLENEVKGRSVTSLDPDVARPVDQVVKPLRKMVTEILSVHEGAFRPLLQEPVIRGILLVLGGTGGITAFEFLLFTGS